MRQVSVVVTIGMLVCGLVGTATAVTWTLPALSKDSADQFSCRVVNNKSSAITVNAEIRSASGTALASNPALSVPAGGTNSIGYFGTTTLGYCVLVGPLLKAKTPATFCAVPDGSGRCDAAVTIP